MDGGYLDVRDTIRKIQCDDIEGFADNLNYCIHIIEHKDPYDMDDLLKLRVAIEQRMDSVSQELMDSIRQEYENVINIIDDKIQEIKDRENIKMQMRREIIVLNTSLRLK